MREVAGDEIIFAEQ